MGSSLFPSRIKDVLALEAQGQEISVSGWLRTRRDSGNLSFLELNDGSCLVNLQILADSELPNFHDLIKGMGTGTALSATGTLVPSPAKGQQVELKASAITLLGDADPANYPLQKKRHSFEFLRTIPQLRSRTNALGAVARVRNSLSFCIHQFFQDLGFLQIHTPIITTSDCEGAGEMFTVTTLDLARSNGEPDFSRDFFGKRAGLTVSGQLQAEVFALSHGRVYTFGPTFRAENSNTTRHLAEFWMVEPEMAFCDLAGDMQLAEALLKNLAKSTLQNCADDLDLFDRYIEKGLQEKLSFLATQPFHHMLYSEAIEALQKSGRDFEFAVKWGMDLQAEHERFLCEELLKAPLFVTNYPASLKPFYMRLDDDGKTVAAMDLLVPGIGEIIGGSQREERLDILIRRMTEAGLDLQEYAWYLDLRRYGSAPHAGFGLGFERLVQYFTGMQNIRDAIPFPRSPGHASP